MSAWLDYYEQALTPDEVAYLSTMPDDLPTVEWIWSEMDRVWNAMGLDNRKPLAEQPIDRFYAHPIWLVNGFFTAADPESMRHRSAIARYLSERNVRRIVDYGGGFGELALVIADAIPAARVDIVEPYPHAIARRRLAEVDTAGFVASLPARCDAVIAQDVLEHVENPIGLAADLAKVTRGGGLLVFANCFYPVVECHLPRTFHLRHTFTSVMRALGLEYVGRVPDAEHAQVYRRRTALHCRSAMRAARISEHLGPAFNRLLAFAAGVKERAFGGTKRS